MTHLNVHSEVSLPELRSNSFIHLNVPFSSQILFIYFKTASLRISAKTYGLLLLKLRVERRLSEGH